MITSLQSKVELLTKKLNSTEDNLHAVTKDYLVLRHNAQVAQRVMVEEKSLLKSERAALERDRSSAARQMSLEMTAAREASRAEIDLATNDFRSQVQARERDMSVLREQYESVQGVYSARVRDLQQQVELCKNKLATVNRRRKMEIMGAASAAKQHKMEIEKLRRSYRSGWRREQVRRGRGGDNDDDDNDVGEGNFFRRVNYQEEERDGSSSNEDEDDGSSDVDLSDPPPVLPSSDSSNCSSTEGRNNRKEDSGQAEDVQFLKGRVEEMEKMIKRLIEER